MPNTITLDIGGNTSAFERDIASATNRVQAKLKNQKFDIGINDNASLPLGRMTGKAEEFDKSLTAATNRVVAFGAAAGAFTLVKRSFDSLVSSTVEVEQALARINVNLGQSKNSLQDFSKQLFDIARNTGQTFESTAKAAEELARQGLSAKETLTRLKDASILARVAGIDTAEAVEKLTAAVNSFSKEGLTTSEIINKLAAVGTKFAVSSKDLGDAISRVGLAASEAGVDFNHLVAIVTAVQQTTQRGGAIISTALNSIFAKIQKPEVLKQLESIGVAVKDTGGAVLPALDILTNLGKVFDNLSQSQQTVIANEIADTRHINIFKATLSELTKGYGAYSSALKTASGATNEAVQKNEQLNQTLQTQINDTQLSIKQFLSSLGNSGTSDLFGGIIKSFNGVLHEIAGANSEKAGEGFGDGLLKGISNVLTGPAFVGIALILGKTFAAVGASAVKSLGAIVGITSEARARAIIQGQINGLLEQATTAELAQYNAATQVEQKKRAILAIDERVTAELQKQALLARALEGEFLGTAAGLSKISEAAGIGGFLSPTRETTLRAGRGFAGGYLPVQKEMADIQRGVGGATPGAKPVILNNFDFGGGQKGTAVANTDEFIVPHLAGGGSGIFNKNMVRAFGLPTGSKKVGNFAGGTARSALDVALGVGGGVGGPLTTTGNLDSFAKASARFVEQEAQQTKDWLDALKKSADSLAASVGPINEMVAQTKIAADKLRDEAKAAEDAKRAFSARIRTNGVGSENDNGLTVGPTAAQRLAGTGNGVDLYTAASNRRFANSGGVESATKQAIISLLAKKADQIDAEFQKDLPALAKQEFNDKTRPKSSSGFGIIGRTAEQTRIARGNLNDIGTNTSIDASALRLNRRDFARSQRDSENNIPLNPNLNKSLRKYVTEGTAGKNAAIKDATQIQARADTQLKSALKTLEKTTGLFGDFGKNAESIIESKGLTGLSANAVTERGNELQNRRNRRVQNISLGAAIGLPIAAGFVGEGQGGTVEGKTKGALGGALQGAGTGAIFGIYGAGIGAAIGGLIGFFNKLSKSTAELAKEFDESNGGKRREIQAENELINALNDKEDALKNHASSDVIDRLNSRIGEARAGVEDRSRLNQITNGTKESRALGLENIQTAQSKSEQRGTTALAIGADPDDISKLARALAQGLSSQDVSGVDLRALKANSGSERFSRSIFGEGGKGDMAVRSALGQTQVNTDGFDHAVAVLRKATDQLHIPFESLKVNMENIGRVTAIIYKATLEASNNTKDTAKLVGDNHAKPLLRGSFVGANFDQGENTFGEFGALRSGQIRQPFNPLGRQRNSLDVINRLAQLGGISVDESNGTIGGGDGIDTKGLQSILTKNRALVGNAGANQVAANFLNGTDRFSRTNFTNRDGSYNQPLIQNSLKTSISDGGEIGIVAKAVFDLLQKKIEETSADVAKANNGGSAYAGSNNKGLLKGILYGKEVDESFGYSKEKASSYIDSHQRPTTQFDVNGEGFNIVKNAAQQMEAAATAFNNVKLETKNTFDVKIALAPDSPNLVYKDNLAAVEASLRKALSQVQNDVSALKGKPNPPSDTVLHFRGSN